MTRPRSRFQRPVFWLGLLSVLVVGAGLAWWRSEVRRRPVPAWPQDAPPVILVIVDTLRADRLGAYGYERDTSPNLDRLAREMIVFENAYSQAPNTPPSVASILTSLYPSSHHFTGARDRLAEAAVTLAEMMHAAGYRTGGFVDEGFLKARFGLGQGFETYDDEGGGFEGILPRARRWLRREPERPFFLLLHTYDTHTPYEETPEPYRDTFLEEAYSGELTSEDLEDVRTGRLEGGLTPEETRHFSDLYDGGILHLDSLLGGFLDDLAEGGILDRAVVLITSDHGEEFMEHGSVLHEKLYRTVTHVPLLLRLPDGAQGGTRVAEIVESIDIAPTILDAAGVPGHAGMQGENLLPVVRGEERRSRGALGEVTWDADLRGYYDGDHHLLVNRRTGRLEVYDVVVDPLEQDNLAESVGEAIGPLQARLEERVRSARSRQYLMARAAASTELDADTERSLRALGYLQ